jgi:hypothetical protein
MKHPCDAGLSSLDTTRGFPTRHFQPEGCVRPILVVNPVADRTFKAFAEQQLDEGTPSLRELETMLRVRYPRAAVHARELSGEPITIWYVYRDGHWTIDRADG